MSLLRRNMTPRLLAANRRNSKRSTGPRTKLGKKHASRNAGKHLVFARATPLYMKELGEDPADFEKLRESLRQAFEPQDGFEEMLVGDMAENRWRRQRLLRAEAGIVASRRRNFVVKRELEDVNQQKGPAPVARLPKGLADGSGSHRNSVAIMEALTMLKESIERVGFRKDDGVWLAEVYGLEDTSPWIGCGHSPPGRFGPDPQATVRGIDQWSCPASNFGIGVVLPAPSEVVRVQETMAVPRSELKNNSTLPPAQSYNTRMGRDATEILKEALALPAEARAALAGSLLDSLDTEVDEDAEAAWQREIQRRVAELDSKVVSPVPWTEVRSRLMATLRHEL